MLGKSTRPSTYELVRSSRCHGGKRRTNMKKIAVWANLKNEITLGDGSADTLGVQILNKKGKR